MSRMRTALPNAAATGRIRSNRPIVGGSSILILPAAIVMGAVVVYPILTTMWLSLTDAPLISLSRPSFTGLSNYVDWLSNPKFWRSFWITLLYTFGVTVGSYAIGLVTALLLNMEFLGRAILRGLVLLPWAIPEVASVMTWNWMLDYQFGIVNSLLGSKIGWVTDAAVAPWTVTMVTIWKQFPLATVVLLAGLQAIPRELYEAANVDGASRLQQFIYVTLPGLKPVNSVLIMMLILYTFKRISIVYLLTGGGPARATEILPVTTYLEAFKYFRLGSASAVGILALLFTLVLTLIYSRLFMREEA